MTTTESLIAAMEHLPIETTRAARIALARGLPLQQQTRMPDDIWDATMRVAAYWEKRNDLFGDQAFAPLEEYFDHRRNRHAARDIEQEATLQIYQTGFIVMLPDDSHGRPVVWFNYSRIETVLEGGNYWTTHSRHDVVGVGLVQANQSHWERIHVHAKPALDLLQECFYVHFHAIHVCVVASQNDRRPMFVQAFLQRFRLLPQLPFKFHVDEQEGILKTLLAEGLPLHAIPLSVGGLWSYDNFMSNFASNNRQQADVVEGDRKAPAIQSQTTVQVRSSSRQYSTPTMGALGSSASVGTAIRPGADLSLRSPMNEARLLVPMAPTSYSPSYVQSTLSTAAVNPTSFVTLIDGHVETLTMQQEGIRQLKEAMEILPTEVSASFYAAMQQVPYLVAEESNPLHFLRFQNYNAWAAAQQLATYWTRRVHIFRDRAFLPLTLSLDGALNQEDIDQIQSGYFTFVSKDLLGRTVICYDPSRRQIHSKESRMRVGFYYWSIMCENDLSSTDGYIAVVMLGRSSFNPIDVTTKECLDMVIEAFPTYTRSFHLVNTPSGLGQRIFFDLLLPLAIRFLGRMVNDRTSIHVGEKEELAVKLGQHGLLRHNLPDLIGGTWTFDNHHLWMRDRLSLECARYGSPVPRGNYTSSSGIVNGERASLDGPRSNRSDSARLDVVDAYVSNDTILAQYGAAMQVAIDGLPSNIKSAYTAALQAAPRVVQKESPTASFLRQNGFDVLGAARRLMTYWQARHEIFGERAHLPLQQTGEGALDRKDIAIISSAYLVCLPLDSSGRAVVFCDGSRLSKSSRQSRLRCSFYMYSIAAEMQAAHNDGIVLLYVLTEASFDRANLECLKMVVESLPISLGQVHLLQHRDSNVDAASALAHTIDQDMLDYFQLVVKGQVHRHSATTKTGLAQSLLTLGLSLSSLPKSIGGKYGFDKFVQWQELRTRYEWDLPAGVTNKEDEAEFDFSGVKRLADLQPEERSERKRKLNVIHSRRKRERERIEVEVLEEQLVELTEEKASLLQEEHRLNELLAEANACLATDTAT